MAKISIIIPCFNASATLRPCLDAVFALEAPDGLEVIVIDDGSTDDSVAIAEGYSCRLVRPGRNGGAAFARNRGIEQATGDHLFFVDADVVLPNDALVLATATMAESGADCVVGVFAAENPFEDFFSQYKSLYTNFKYQNLQGGASLNTAVTLVRRQVLDDVGGFDEGMSTVEDNELGDRIFRHGFKIVIERRLEVLHLKQFSMAGLLRNDYRKAVGLAELLASRMRAGEWSPGGEFTDISPSHMMNVPIVFVTLAGLLVAAAGWVTPGILAAAAGGVLFGLNNGAFWAYLGRRKGVLFTAAAVPFSFLVYTVVGLATVVGLRAFLRRRTA
jgi:glycosyltransferase involved in cell wall biosynthesis